MALLLYKDVALKQPLPQVVSGGKQIYRLELPRNHPGGVSKTTFYIYNSSIHPVEDLQILHNNTQVDFYYKDSIAPKGKMEVTVEWRAPLTFQDALALFFKIEAFEVVKPRI